MSKIKLALIAAEFLPNWGGAGTYNVRLVKYLKDDIDIHVITPKRRIPNSSVNYEEKEILDFFDNKIHVHFIANAGDTFVYNAVFQLAVLKALPQLHKKYNFDLIHTDHPHMSDILYRLFGKLPSVTTVHTTIEHHLMGIKSSAMKFREIESSERYQLMLEVPLKIVENYYLKRCPHIITVSNWMEKELSNKHGINDIEVIHSGVETDVFKPYSGVPSDILPEIKSPIVLFTSRMTAAKGAYFLIKAMSQIISHNNNVHFVFCGSEIEQPWKAMLEAEEIAPNYYTFLGYYPYDKLPLLYARAAIYVCPSLCENLPARLLEAMSCELPVVATNIYAIPEAIIDGENGLLVPPHDENALADAILSLLDDRQLCNRLGKNARNTVVNNFEWKSLAAQIKSKYEKIVECI
jgi:glycosyltransferase involved in cell wall biosynthesis